MEIEKEITIDVDRLKIGYFIKYKDPKDNTEQAGMVISFDDDIILIWHKSNRCPYPISRIQQIKTGKTYRLKKENTKF